MTNGPVNSNNNSTLPSTPTAVVSAQTPVSVPVQIAAEHKHKPKPAEIKKSNTKKDDGRGTDRKVRRQTRELMKK